MSDLDEVAMGSEERQELERKIEDLKERVEDCEKTQKDIYITVCQKLVTVLTEHLAHCDQEGIDYETLWFVNTLDNCRQLLVQVCVCVCVCAKDRLQYVFLFTELQ